MSDSSSTDLLADALATTGAIIAGVRPDQEHLPTPCEQFDVQQLVSHLVGWSLSFAGRLSGQPWEADPNAYVAGADAAQQFTRAGAQIVQAYREELPSSSELPIGMLVMEFVTHGWDLAQATGQQAPFTEEQADAGLAFGLPMLKPEYRGPGLAFGEIVPTSADDDSLAHLLAFLGRDPHWTS